MFCRQSTVPWCLKFIPISWMGPKHAPKDKDLFSNEFICTGACACSSYLNYAHKCIENSVNAQKCPNDSRLITITHTTVLFVSVDRWNKPDCYMIQWILFRPQRRDVPYRNHHACCEKLRFVRSVYPNLPHLGQNLYHGMLMPLHDTMPSFMNFRWVLDLLDFKNQVSQCLAGNQ